MEQYIFGIRAIEEAINAGKQIDKIIARKGLNGDLFKALQALCKEKQIRIQYALPEVLDRVTTSNHQGVIAFMNQVVYSNLDEVVDSLKAKGESPFLLVLDGITDVRNFGAIARSAECAGVHAIIVPEKGSAAINGESIKTSAGALHRIPVCQSQKLFFAVKYLKEHGIKIVAATEKDGSVPYFKADLTGPVAIIMGAEDKGISPQLIKQSDVRAQIPMLGNIESLNVSVAAGILMFEKVRQSNK